MNIAEQIKDLRLSKGITQKELAEQTGISLQSIINYENGRREPNSKAMVALERYFGVSGEYLRGENEDCVRPAVWEDAEIMEAVRESLPDQLTKLNAILKESTAQEQKHTFDILVELGHILKMEDPARRAAAMTLIQAVFAATTRCIDVCAGAEDDIDPATRPKQARHSAMKSYAEALRKAFLIPK